jgi:hypothetical protein
MKYKVLILAGLLIVGGITAGFIAKERLLAPTDTSTSIPPVVTSATTTTGTGSGKGGTQVVLSGIRGRVLLGPMCPVMRDPPDSQCADRLFQTNLVLTTLDGARIVKSFSSDINGVFQVSVAPGFYLIRSAPGGAVMPSCSKGEAVEVRANAYTETTVYCDTGIR